jgi:hypothetical protein
MSIFGTVVTDLESFAHKFETEFEKLWGKAPNFVTVATTTLTFVGPILEAVLAAVAPEALPLVTPIIAKVESDLAAAKSLLTVVGPTVSLKGLVAGAQTDLSTLAPVANITDPKTVANINLVLGELSALLNAFPATTPPVAATPAPATT